MKNWGRRFYYMTAAICMLGLVGCNRTTSVMLDGSELPLTMVEDRHWVPVESLQDYGFALQKGEKSDGSSETSWLLYPLAPDMKTLERNEIVLHDDMEQDKVYCNGLLLPAKVIDGEWMVSVEDLTGQSAGQSYMTYGGIWERAEELQSQRYSCYLVEKKEEAKGEWQIRLLRPTMPLRTSWGCVLFEKVWTDDIPFTAESFQTDYVSLPELVENMGFSFALHKGILHLHQESAVDTYEVPMKMVAEDFLKKRLISGYVMTGEGMRVGCVYDGRTLYANLADLQKVFSDEGYVYDKETRTFAKKA